MFSTFLHYRGLLQGFRRRSLEDASVTDAPITDAAVADKKLDASAAVKTSIDAPEVDADLSRIENQIKDFINLNHA